MNWKLLKAKARLALICSRSGGETSGVARKLRRRIKNLLKNSEAEI